MSLRFSIALLLLAASLAYAVFKLYQGRSGSGPRRESAGLTDDERLQNLVSLIPSGMVMTYATVAEHSGTGKDLRQISQSMRAFAEENKVPWWRVVRQSGRMGQVMPASTMGKKQQQLLQEEGVRFKDGGFPLEEYQWTPPN